MLTYRELIEIRDKLASGDIDVNFAKARSWNDFKGGQRSWHTTDWKERRRECLKDKCEICGSKETLTLQHLFHPGKYSQYSRDITRAYTEKYINTNSDIDKCEFTNYVLDKYDYVPVPLCPNCKNTNPSKRVRKTPQYRCTACRHEFDEVISRSVDDLVSIFYENEDALEVRDGCFVSKEWGNNQNLSNIKYWLLRERAQIRDAELIQKEAFLLYLNDWIRYLSFEDAITACKKCAFNFDIKNMDLCPKCNLHYKGLQYPTCIECLPEEKRKAVLESIAFGKYWREMHKHLGVD